MTQIRLFVRGPEAELASLSERLEFRFEEDAFPVATTEIDEDAKLWECSVYAPADREDDLRAAMAELGGASLSPADIGMETLPDIDWVAHSLEGLKPVRAGRFLVHGSHDAGAVLPGEIAIEIDAGQAFGTGHHGTTAGCLEMIDAVMRRRLVERTLDLGTGSGVLAIAIHKLRRNASVLATDIDPVAVRVAAHNAGINTAGGAIDFVTAPGFHHPVFAQKGPFDLIVANILARPLMRLAPDIARHAASGADIVLSGILAEQRWKVISAFTGQNCAHRRTIWREGWVTIHLQRG